LIVIQTAIGSQAEAKELAKKIIDAKLAACVQIIPSITSIYFWKGKLEESDEWLLNIKTTTDAAFAFIEQWHPYETPEILSFSADVNSSYEKWMTEQIK
jgi:periplasmic divalent cation tolerance protein